jgi:hypothetical protein
MLQIDIRELLAPWSRMTKQASNSSSNQGGRKRRDINLCEQALVSDQP